MAYIKLIEKPCNILGCKKKAFVSLFNNKNSHFGDYCRVHGDRKLRELKESEKKGWDEMLEEARRERQAA